MLGVFGHNVMFLKFDFSSPWEGLLTECQFSLGGRTEVGIWCYIPYDIEIGKFCFVLFCFVLSTYLLALIPSSLVSLIASRVERSVWAKVFLDHLSFLQ